MNTLHKVNHAQILAAFDSQSDEIKDSIAFNLAVTGGWTGKGQIDFSAPSGSSTGPFPEITAFSFRAKSIFGVAEFSAIDLAFAYWNVGPSGSLISFSILTNPVNGFCLSIQLGKDAAKLDGKKFATLEAGTLTHSSACTTPRKHREILKRRWMCAPRLREV